MIWDDTTFKNSLKFCETLASRFYKVPTLPAAILQIVLCAAQIGEHQGLEQENQFVLFY